MGIINGLFGAVRKKIGPLVSRRINGRNVISRVPLQRPQAFSQKQNIHQARFKLVAGFLSQIMALINIGFSMKRQTRFNVAMHCNFSRMVKGTYPDFSIDYPQVIFSAGKLQNANSPSATVDDQGDVLMSWLSDAENEYNRHTDLACFLAYDAEHQRPICVLKVANRADLAYRLVLPPQFSSTALHCYMCMISADGKERSRSVYIDCLTVNKS